jgi:hypothetical protein
VTNVVELPSLFIFFFVTKGPVLSTEQISLVFILPNVVTAHWYGSKGGPSVARCTVHKRRSEPRNLQQVLAKRIYLTDHLILPPARAGSPRDVDVSEDTVLYRLHVCSTSVHLFYFPSKIYNLLYSVVKSK